jgi:hypothetical protein
MAIYRKRINGRKVWWVRVNYRGLNASRVCESKEVAKDAESTLRVGLRRKIEHTEQTGLLPATIKALFEHYVADLAARGKGPNRGGRAAQTATAFEAVLPALLTTPGRPVQGEGRVRLPGGPQSGGGEAQHRQPGPPYHPCHAQAGPP